MAKSKLTLKILSLEICIRNRDFCSFVSDYFLFSSLGLLSRSASEFHRFLFGTEPIWQTRENFYCPFSYLHRFFSDTKDLGKTGKSDNSCFDFCLCFEKLFLIRRLLSGNLPPNSSGPYWGASIFNDYAYLQPAFKT